MDADHLKMGFLWIGLEPLKDGNITNAFK